MTCPYQLGGDFHEADSLTSYGSGRYLNSRHRHGRNAVRPSDRRGASENPAQAVSDQVQLEEGLRMIVRAAEKGDLLTKRGMKTPLEMLQTIASHNSYHVGQVVVLRQRLCAWPPPSGGLTW